MGATSIGNAALVLTSNGSALLSGLTSTASAIKGWGDKVQTGVASTFKGVANKVTSSLGNAKALLGGAGSAIGMAIAGPLGGAIGGAVGQAAGSIVETIYDAVTQPFDKINVFAGIVKQSKVLGVSASSLQGMTNLLKTVGIEGDALGQTFASMGKNVADAAGGHGRAAPAFKQLGIDAHELLSLPVDEQFKRIADEINKLPPGASQASAALHIFGGEGAKLLPLLQKGKAGIEEFIATQKKTGAILSDSDLKAAADAAQAWGESKKLISSTWDGLVNRATIIAAPVIKFIGSQVTKLFSLLSPVFEWLGRAVSKTAEILTAVFDVFGEWASEGIAWLKSLATSVFAWGDSFPTVEQIVLRVFKNVGIGAAYVWDTLKSGVGAMAFVGSFIVEGFGKLVEAFKNTIKDLLNIAGELPDDLGGKFFRDKAKEVDKWGGAIQQAGRDMREWGKNAFNSWGQSASKVAQWFDALANRRKQEDVANNKLAADLNPAKYNAVAAMVQGSKEAYSVAAKFDWDSSTGAAKKIEEKNNDELKKLNQNTQKVINAIGSIIGVGVI